VNGNTLIPVGATVEGRVTKVSEPRRISGKPTLGILPEAVILPGGERYYLDATLVDTNIHGSDVSTEGQFKGSGHDRRDTLETGGGTAGGMLIGGLIGGGPGILIGGAVGATSTTVHWLAKHRSATLPAGTEPAADHGHCTCGRACKQRRRQVARILFSMRRRQALRRFLLQTEVSFQYSHKYGRTYSCEPQWIFPTRCTGR
jgi:hypothetical protein